MSVAITMMRWLRLPAEGFEVVAPLKTTEKHDYQCNIGQSQDEFIFCEM